MKWYVFLGNGVYKDFLKTWANAHAHINDKSMKKKLEKIDQMQEYLKRSCMENSPEETGLL